MATIISLAAIAISMGNVAFTIWTRRESIRNLVAEKQTSARVSACELAIAAAGIADDAQRAASLARERYPVYLERMEGIASRCKSMAEKTSNGLEELKAVDFTTNPRTNTLLLLEDTRGALLQTLSHAGHAQTELNRLVQEMIDSDSRSL